MWVRVVVRKERRFLKAKWIGISAVVLGAVGIVGYRSTIESIAAKAPSSPPPMASAAAGRSIVLVADLGEADAPCVCGKIIRSVRSAGAKGIPVKEIDPEKSPELASSYRARMSPTVILLDGNGKEVRRFEGESNDTLASLESELSRLRSRTP